MASPAKEENIIKNFINNGSDRTVQDCISKLKFISRIREGDILDTKSLTLQEWDWTVTAYRTFVDRKQSRENSLEFYRMVIREAFTVCISYLEYPPDHFLHHTALTILDCLEKVKNGLVNHNKTYASDRKHVADVETLIETTEDKIADLRRSIASLANPANPANPANHTEKQKKSK